MHSDEQAARRPAAEHDVGRELCDDIDRTLVAMPNGKLADATIESLTARDRYRLAATFALLPDTPPAKVRAFVDGAEAFSARRRALGCRPDQKAGLRDALGASRR